MYNKTIKHNIVTLLTFSLAILCFVAAALAEESDWPREIKAPGAKILMYQPQLETFTGDKLTARAAVSVTPTGETEPTFGAVWITARVSTDRDERTVTPLEVKVTEAKFPNASKGKVEKLKALLEKEMPQWNLTISLDRLLTMMDLIEKEKNASEDIKTTPPKIIITTHPAVLITIDGKPELSKVKDSSLMRVVNTPFFIVLDPPNKTYYLKAGEDWLKTTGLMEKWETEPSPPQPVVTAAKDFTTEDQAEAEQKKKDEMPQIIVVTEPTELIVIDGQPKYSTIYGVNSLYVSNTTGDVFLEIDTQQYYVLISGRWYTSDSFDGKWEYISSDKMPADFARIPPGSTKDHVRASISGTDEAKDAVLETYVPQTASVKRSETTVDVVYDGDPEFSDIESTEMQYAANTSYSVIKYGTNYYCCDNAVWFVSTSPTGPWTVCVTVPQVIYTIPPSCPVYNVRYVYVYDYTPEIVYVGYTPGYVGCYHYGGTVVYGTGYYYRGWYRSAYYARPATWGFAVRYNPYTGNWGFRAGYRGSSGWFAVGGSSWNRGRWGPGGYRNVDIDVNRNININNSRNNIYNRKETRPASRPRTSDRRTATMDRRTGTVDRRTDRARTPQARPSTRPSTRPATQPAARNRTPNNVYADRNGNVHRKTDNGWQQRDNTGWTNRTQPQSRPATQQRTTTNRDHSNLNRQSQSRERGNTRTNNYQRSRTSTPTRSMPSRSGGSRGGSRGGRR